MKALFLAYYNVHGDIVDYQTGEVLSAAEAYEYTIFYSFEECNDHANQMKVEAK